MFLTLGEKIKYLRRKYDLKQDAFSKFGISQNYISMIESEKRQPTQEMIENIYDAMDVLTNGQVKSDYDKVTFSLNVRTQVQQYIDARLSNECIMDHYEESLTLSKTYGLTKQIYQLEMEMGAYFRSEKKEEKSTHFFLNALQYAIQLNENVEKVYAALGRSMRLTGNLKQALVYYRLAIEFAEKDTEIFYSILEVLALVYADLEQYDEAITICNEIFPHCQNKESSARTLITLHYCYMQLEKYDEATHIYHQFIELDNPQYLSYIYHNAAYSLLLKGRSKEALRLVDEAIPLREGEFQIGITLTLKGKILATLKQYPQALEIFLQTRPIIMANPYQSHIEEWYSECVNLYYVLHDFDKVKELFAQMQDLTRECQFQRVVLEELKVKIITDLMRDYSMDRNDSSDLYEFILNLRP